MKVKTSVIINIFAGILIFAGFLALLGAGQLRLSNAQARSQPPVTANLKPSAVSEPDVITGQPISLSIPDLGLNKSVIEGVFNTKSRQWTLTLDKVQHAAITRQPNNAGGLTFMYGHNRKDVFSKLPSIVPGMVAEVRTENGHVFYYRFVSTQKTSPEDVSIFAYEGSPILVLQTCTGIFFQNRQLYTFELTGVDGDV